MQITDKKAAEICHLLRQGASMARELIGLHRLDARFGERLAKDFEEALTDLMMPAPPCRCTAYPHPHRLGSGDCCGCESAPDCWHWIRIPDYYGTGDRDNVRYERAETK